jgi:hypothetical protein
MLYSVENMNDDQINNRRLERLYFHLETGDYFPMLATIFGFLEETVTECGCASKLAIAPIETDVIKNVRKDLEYLHKNYKIVRATDN